MDYTNISLEETEFYVENSLIQIVPSFNEDVI